jgi:hypothetical protein
MPESAEAEISQLPGTCDGRDGVVIGEAAGDWRGSQPTRTRSLDPSHRVAADNSATEQTRVTWHGFHKNS